MKYYYKTKYGTFFILPQNNGYELWIKELSGSEDKLGWYESKEGAADSVYHCVTGFDDWDLLIDVDEPSELEEWSIMK